MKAENRNLMEALFVPETRVGLLVPRHAHLGDAGHPRSARGPARLQPAAALAAAPGDPRCGLRAGQIVPAASRALRPAAHHRASTSSPSAWSAPRAEAEGLPVELQRGDISALALPDDSVDLIFCHQTFHHLTRQREALAEFHRVLKPGGLFLFAESTRAYITPGSSGCCSAIRWKRNTAPRNTSR